MFAGFLPAKLSVHFLPEMWKAWVVVPRIECFVSRLIYSFPILSACFKASRNAIVLFLPLPNCSNRFAEKWRSDGCSDAGAVYTSAYLGQTLKDLAVPSTLVLLQSFTSIF